ncbi:MAG TPA: transporter [Bryobacteraceae bacterium]|nr:transporter [Bryobacteraceae bacterium]
MIIVFEQRLVWAVIALAAGSGRLQAQFTDPRTYDNSPVGINQLTLGYGFAHANASIDSSLVIPGAKLDLNVGILDYIRGVSFFRRYAWIEASVPIAGLAGAVTGTTLQGSVTGAGDSSYVFGALLKGGPALSVHDFPTYDPTTTFGVSLTVTAPTGVYNADKVLNLGSDRWSFKPEIAVSHPFGPNHNWVVDGYANAYFFTDNTGYHGREILRQQPLPGFEGHLSYSFTSSIWASVDLRYAFRGDTLVDSGDQQNSQQNVTLGSEVNVSLSPKHSLLFLLAKAVVYRNAPASTIFGIKYIYGWGKGYK